MPRTFLWNAQRSIKGVVQSIKCHQPTGTYHGAMKIRFVSFYSPSEKRELRYAKNVASDVFYTFPPHIIIAVIKNAQVQPGFQKPCKSVRGTEKAYVLFTI